MPFSVRDQRTLRESPAPGSAQAFHAVPDWKLLEKENQGDLQSVRDVIEASRSHPFGAVLILRNLLTRNAECVGELLLRYAEPQSAHPHAGVDMRVDGVGGSVREHENLCRSGDRLGHRSTSCAPQNALLHLRLAVEPFFEVPPKSRRQAKGG
jgi:hypothetical protein